MTIAHPSMSWTVGDARIVRVAEVVVPVDARIILPDVTSDHIDPHRPWIDPYVDDRARIMLSVHSFVVQSCGTTIVVDTCIGVEAPQPLPGDDAFADRLDDAVEGGLEAVDVVLCTHLHFDHVGWNLRTVDGRSVPTFPNARYLVARRELESGDDDHQLRQRSIDPLLDAGVLDPIEPAHRITAEVRTVPTPGHTPGHVSVLVESGGETGLITGDTFHSPVQIAHPELVATTFDDDVELAAATRRALLERYTDTPTLVLGTHFAPPTAGRLRRGRRGIELEPLPGVSRARPTRH
jgi:glyoxylase-like metal-dependent hydrolase (beta-lactamase superfamily II)